MVICVKWIPHKQNMEPSPSELPPMPHRGNDKIWSMLSHLSLCLGVGLLLPLVVYLAMRRESEFVAANAREALNFHLSLLIYALCCIPLVFILIGVPLAIVIGLGGLVLTIIATVKASDGQCYLYIPSVAIVFYLRNRRAMLK